MQRKTLIAVIAVIVVVFLSISTVAWHYTQSNTASDLPVSYKYNVVATYPHDISAFTQGLDYDNGFLYESTGGFGSSSLRRVNLETGEVLQQIWLTDNYFGEGLAVVNGSLMQLTWTNGVGFVYDKETLALRNNFSYSTEGWGLTYADGRLIMSDGSSKLYFLDPNTFQRINQVTVHYGNETVTELNELEYVNGDIYANIWHQQKIAIINPQTGQVKGWIDLTGIYQPQGSEDVLNGIAYDEANNRIFITGKNWPNLYQITIIPKS
jgi:glutaminyl-peptide cyclotransferase